MYSNMHIFLEHEDIHNILTLHVNIAVVAYKKINIVVTVIRRIDFICRERKLRNDIERNKHGSVRSDH